MSLKTAVILIFWIVVAVIIATDLIYILTCARKRTAVANISNQAGEVDGSIENNQTE